MIEMQTGNGCLGRGLETATYATRIEGGASVTVAKHAPVYDEMFLN